MKYILFVLLVSNIASAKNLHLIDRDRKTGFQIYRYGQPDKEDVVEMKKLGITEVMILSGDAYSKGNEGDTKSFIIIHNEKQSDDIPVSKAFLQKFDDWVADAKTNGKKIAFRCECGCHRTGRLAAYYQMKYQNLTSEDASAIMDEHGSLMFLHRALYPQVRAMEQLLQDQVCTQGQKYCVKEN